MSVNSRAVLMPVVECVFLSHLRMVNEVPILLRQRLQSFGTGLAVTAVYINVRQASFNWTVALTSKLAGRAHIVSAVYSCSS